MQATAARATGAAGATGATDSSGRATPPDEMVAGGAQLAQLALDGTGADAQPGCDIGGGAAGVPKRDQGFGAGGGPCRRRADDPTGLGIM